MVQTSSMRTCTRGYTSQHGVPLKLQDIEVQLVVEDGPATAVNGEGSGGSRICSSNTLSGNT